MNGEECISKTEYSKEEYNQEVFHIKNWFTDSLNEPSKSLKVTQILNESNPDQESCQYLDIPEAFAISFVNAVDIQDDKYGDAQRDKPYYQCSQIEDILEEKKHTSFEKDWKFNETTYACLEINKLWKQVSCEKIN